MNKAAVTHFLFCIVSKMFNIKDNLGEIILFELLPASESVCWLVIKIMERQSCAKRLNLLHLNEMSHLFIPLKVCERVTQLFAWPYLDSHAPCLCTWIVPPGVFRTGGLWGPSGLHQRWRQLPVWDCQLGRGLRSLWEAWRLYQCGEIHQLDQFSDQT